MPPHHMIGEENGKHRYTGSKAHRRATGQPDNADARTEGATAGNETGDTSASTGIRAGEIVAYRAWNIIEDGEYKGLLGSMVVPYLWRPKAVNKAGGYPDKTLAVVNYYAGTWCADTLESDGFFAFKTIEKAILEYTGALSFRVNTIPTVVFGRVALWGAVTEYSEGYRAEFAKILGIDKMEKARWRKWRLNKLYV